MARDAFEQRIIDDIANHNWSGVIVLEDEHGPGFEYTIGLLSTHDHPEVIVFGLPQQTSHDLLWQVFREVCDGKDFSREDVYEDLVESQLCKVRSVHTSWHGEFFGYALCHRKHAKLRTPFAAVQLLWPDHNGQFPGDPTCHDSVRARQPDLSKRKPAD